MVRRVQNAPPEDPDALTLGIEERPERESPRVALPSQELQAGECPVDELLDERFDGNVRREHLRGGGLRNFQELTKKPALR